MSDNPIGYTLVIKAFIQADDQSPDAVKACADRAKDMIEECHRMADACQVDATLGRANIGRRRMADACPGPRAGVRDRMSGEVARPPARANGVRVN